MPVLFSVPFLIIPNAPMATGIVTVFKCHNFSTLISRSLYLDRFPHSATETCLSPGIFKSINLEVFSLLSLIVTFGLFALICFALLRW